MARVTTRATTDQPTATGASYPKKQHVAIVTTEKVLDRHDNGSAYSYGRQLSTPPPPPPPPALVRPKTKAVTYYIWYSYYYIYVFI